MKKKLNIINTINYRGLIPNKLFERSSDKIFCKLCLKSSVNKNSFWLHIKSSRHLKNLKFFFYIYKFGQVIFKKSSDKNNYLTCIPYRIVKLLSGNSTISFLIQLTEFKYKKYFSKNISTFRFFFDSKISVMRKNTMFLIYLKNSYFLLRLNETFLKLNKIILIRN
jgi:hypothetical protein